jgi:hypothetical protein
LAKARSLITDASYDAETRNTLRQALEEIWATVGASAERKRLRLAEVLLTLASVGHRDLPVLTRLAEKAMMFGK